MAYLIKDKISPDSYRDQILSENFQFCFAKGTKGKKLLPKINSNEEKTKREIYLMNFLVDDYFRY